MVTVLLNPLLEFYGSKTTLAQKLRMSVRTIENHIGNSPKRLDPSTQLKDNSEALFEATYPFPLPSYQNSSRKRLTAAKKSPGSAELLHEINDIDDLLTDCRPDSAWHAAGLKYLEFLACHARAIYSNRHATFGGVVTFRNSLKRAEAALLEGRQIIAEALEGDADHPDQKSLRALDVWLFMNWIVVIGSYVKGDRPPDPAKVYKTLDDNRALKHFMAALVLDEMRHEWRVAYNGLDVASRMNAKDEELALFYHRLLEFDPRFSDFEFSPGEVLAIKYNPDWSHFRTRFNLNPTAFEPKNDKE